MTRKELEQAYHDQLQRLAEMKSEVESLESELQGLASENAELSDGLKRIAALESENAKLAREKELLEAEMQVLLNRLYRPSSERIDPNQLRLFESDPLPELPPSPKEKSAPAKKNGHGRAAFRKDIPRIPVELDLPEEDRVCDECGDRMRIMGQDVTERGHIIPAQMVVHQYRRPKYGCPKGHQVKTADLPPSLIERCKYEPSVYAHLAVAKYHDHQPLNRLEGIYKRHGFHLPRSTMWEMLSRLDEVVTAPIVEQMHKEVLEETHLQADETPVTVQIEDRKGSKKAYLWTYGWRAKRMIDFTMTRERDGPVQFLRDWKGTLQTDGYSGYDEVVRRNDLVRVGCWAHLRRKVKEALETGSEDARHLMIPIQRLFRVERAITKRAEDRGLDETEALELRQSIRHRVSRRILQKLHQVAQILWEQRSTLPKSMLGKALTYLDRQRDPLERFLVDPRVPIHNNDAERSLRHVALGRNNWMIFGSERGAKVGSHLISLMLTCKAHDIDPERYLEDVIRRIDTTPASEIHTLTPWAWAEEQAANVYH